MTEDGIHLDRNHKVSALVGKDAVLLQRVIYIRTGLVMYDKTGGRMILTRGATPKNLLGMATEYTAKTYKNTAKGRAQCVADLDKWIAEMKAALPIFNHEGKEVV